MYFSVAGKGLVSRAFATTSARGRPGNYIEQGFCLEYVQCLDIYFFSDSNVKQLCRVFDQRNPALHSVIYLFDVIFFLQFDHNSSWSRTAEMLKDEENWFPESSSSCSTRARDCSTDICCLSDSIVSSSSCEYKQRVNHQNMGLQGSKKVPFDSGTSRFSCWASNF